HMTDPDYCFTLSFFDSAVNATRGDVCAGIARSWMSALYSNLMPEGDDFRVPVNDAKELQAWCKERHGKSFAELQIESAEWAMTFLSRRKNLPTQVSDAKIAEIKKRIAELRAGKEVGRRGYFAIEVVSWYTEK